MQNALKEIPDEPAAGEDVEPEPMATAFAIWQVPGQGTQRVRIKLPRSVVMQYAEDVSQPEVTFVTLGKLYQEIERDLFGRGLGGSW